jgi:hypothetical protein
LAVANVRPLTAFHHASIGSNRDFSGTNAYEVSVAPNLLSPEATTVSLEEGSMLLPEQVQRLVELALAEFAPEWQVVGLCSELSLHNPDHWVSGLGTFGLVLRNRQSKAAKVLGWRNGDFKNASYHRGISYRVLEAYADRITDPIRRYFEEIGLILPGRIPTRFAQTTGARSN